MFSTLRSLFGRRNGERGETKERQKEAALPSESHPGRKKWSWRRHSESWEVDAEFPEGGGIVRESLGCKSTSVLILSTESQGFQNISLSSPKPGSERPKVFYCQLTAFTLIGNCVNSWGKGVHQGKAGHG